MVNFFRLKQIFISSLTIFSCQFLSQVKAEEISSKNLCLNGNLEASYELENTIIYICEDENEKVFRQFSKNDNQEIITIPASGNFPTYAAIEGELSDPNSNIYNISPYNLTIIKASIIQSIQPVINSTYHPSGANVTILEGEKKQRAIAICGQKKPVRLYETATDNIYICISAPEDNVNAIDLTYIQQNKDNPEQLINLPAQLYSSFGYQADNDNQRYLINFDGLEIYQNQQKINSQPVIKVYLVTSTGKE